MADISDVQVTNKKLSHKQYRLMLKKKKRKLKRQLAAQARDDKLAKELAKLERSPGYQYRRDREEMEHEILEEHAERERRRLHYLWLQREEEAMVQFKRLKAQVERVRLQKEEEARKARDDFEKLQQKEDDEKKIKEDALKEMLEKLPEGDEPWHNPIAPPKPVEVPDNREVCQFFTKTGACRFGDRCSRKHNCPEKSCVILLRGMFTHFCMEEMFHDEYDTDIGLEFEESDMYQFFTDFYEDVLPEFKKIGKVVQFKVCCNQEQHLRGNVYVQFESENEAEQALRTFNGRFYAGKQLSCEFTGVTKWKSAICGLFLFKRCPKGRTCNFLHVFVNPNGEFREADRDFVDSRFTGNISQRNGSSRHSRYSPLHNYARSRSTSMRNTRRSRSRTPPRFSRRSRSRSTSPPPSSRRSKFSRSPTPPSRRSRSPRRRKSRHSNSRSRSRSNSRRRHSKSKKSNYIRKKSKRSSKERKYEKKENSSGSDSSPRSSINRKADKIFEEEWVEKDVS